MGRAWTVQNKNQSWIFIKSWSKHRQVISSKFPKSFRADGDLVVLGELLKVSLKVYQKITKKFVKHHQITSSPKTPRKLTWNHLTVFWLKFEKLGCYFVRNHFTQHQESYTILWTTLNFYIIVFTIKSDEFLWNTIFQSIWKLICGSMTSLTNFEYFCDIFFYFWLFKKKQPVLIVIEVDNYRAQSHNHNS